MVVLELVLLLGLPIAAAIVSRLKMLRLATARSLPRSQGLLYILSGTGKDALVLLLPLLLASGCSFSGVSDAVPYAVFAFCCSLTVVLNIVDTAVFAAAFRRFFQDMIKEIRLVNIAVALSGKQKILLAGTAAGALLYGYAIMAAHPLPGPLGLGIAVLLIGAGCLCIEMYAAQVSREAPKDYVIRLLQERYATVRAATVLNFISVLGTALYADKLGVPKKIEAYSGEEADFLRKLNLLDCGHYRHADDGKVPFSRIICINLESVAQQMLPFYNPNVPPETMPFLTSLIENHVALHNYYTANAPSEEGLWASHASRLSREYDFNRIGSELATLPRLLHEKGFASCFIYGETGDYGLFTPFVRRLLGFQNVFSREKIKEVYPTAQDCPLGWGIADSSLYGLALVLLEEFRNRPIFLNLLTANTHPNFFYTLEEGMFPPAIRKTRSALLRSLYEADKDIMNFLLLLGKMKLLTDETLIIITADHSPNHGREFLKYTDLFDFYPTRIPCVFITPDREKNPFRELSQAVLCDQLDFLPTLADALHLRKPDTVMGRSLFLGGKKTAVRRQGYAVRLTTPGEEYSFDLVGGSSGVEERAVRKWYANGMLRPYVRT